MKSAFIFHGSYGHPAENWIPWLKTELEARGYKVVVPCFPSPEGQSYEDWMQVIQPHVTDMGEDTLLVGHSIGPAFMCCVLEQLKQPVRQVVMVSGFLGLLGNEAFDQINYTISDRVFDWSKVRQGSKQFTVLHGSNDPYVPLERSIELARHLGVDPIIIENGGHLNEAAGFLQFPKLLEVIE